MGHDCNDCADRHHLANNTMVHYFITNARLSLFSTLIRYKLFLPCCLAARVIESEIADEELRSRTRLEHLCHTAIKWAFVLLLGLSMGLLAFLINTAVENIGGLKFQLATGLIQNNR